MRCPAFTETILHVAFLLFPCWRRLGGFAPFLPQFCYDIFCHHTRPVFGNGQPVLMGFGGVVFYIPRKTGADLFFQFCQFRLALRFKRGTANLWFEAFRARLRSILIDLAKVFRHNRVIGAFSEIEKADRRVFGSEHAVFDFQRGNAHVCIFKRKLRRLQCRFHIRARRRPAVTVADQPQEKRPAAFYFIKAGA